LCVPDTASDLTEPVTADISDTKFRQLGNGLLPALLAPQINDTDSERDRPPYRLDNVRSGLGLATTPAGDLLMLARIIGVIRRRQAHPRGREHLPKGWSDVYQVGEDLHM
jgi:hypothetical protein